MGWTGKWLCGCWTESSLWRRRQGKAELITCNRWQQWAVRVIGGDERAGQQLLSFHPVSQKRPDHTHQWETVAQTSLASYQSQTGCRQPHLQWCKPEDQSDSPLPWCCTSQVGPLDSLSGQTPAGSTDLAEEEKEGSWVTRSPIVS